MTRRNAHARRRPETAAPRLEAVPAPAPPPPHFPGAAGPVLLGERARDARVPGACPLCSRGIVPPERIARLLGDGRLVHVTCLGSAQGVAR